MEEKQRKMDHTVNIKGLNKLTLLAQLWANQRSASWFLLTKTTPPLFDIAKARELLQCEYIDYCCGRAIKMDLRGDKITPWLYDRDASRKAADIVKSMREKQ